MLDETLLLSAVLAAGLASALVPLCLAKVVPPTWHGLLSAAAVAGGYLAGQAVLGYWPHAGVGEDRDRFLNLLVPVALLSELLAAAAPRRAWLAGAIRVVVAALAGPVLLWGSVYLAGAAAGGWSATEAAVWLAAVPLGWLAVDAGARPLAARTPVRLALVLAVTALGTTLALVLSGSLTLGFETVPLVGALAGVAAHRVLAKDAAGGWLSVGLLLLAALLLRGCWFSQLPLGFAVGLWFVPMLQWAGEAAWPRRPLVRQLVRAQLVLLPVAAVVLCLGLRLGREDKPTTPAGEPTTQDYLNFGK